MELIIKPTSDCNFRCKFCAASNCKIPTLKSVPDNLKILLLKSKPSTIIFTGGEPTMSPPEFYKEILDITDQFGTTISLTSNLYNIIDNMADWSSLLKHDRFKVSTSFQYGDSRILKDESPYTEKMFIDTIDQFRFWAKYTPSFISVIDEHNDQYAIDTVLLAKKLHTTAKLNNCNSEGRAVKWYPRYKIFKIYFDIIDRGLEKYEENVRDRAKGLCPLNTTLMCENTIRALYIDDIGDIRWSSCEEELNRLNSRAYDNCFYCTDMKINKPTVTDHCYECELFRICNGCKINVLQAKEDPNYCKEMKAIKDKIIEYGWML